MAPTETLISYIKKESHNKQEPTIIADSREANTAEKIIRGLRERGADIRITTLGKGDYVLSDTCAVERKTVQDFAYTLTHRHLFDQLLMLKEAYSNGLILLEGYLPMIYKFSRIKPSSVWGAMFGLAKSGVAIVNTTSYRETIDFLYVAARQEQIIEKRRPTIHPIKKCKTTSDAQIFLVASLPNIGIEKAKAILKLYKTPLNALKNTSEWPKMVYGLGPKITGKVKEVLTTTFEE